MLELHTHTHSTPHPTYSSTNIYFETQLLVDRRHITTPEMTTDHGLYRNDHICIMNPVLPNALTLKRQSCTNALHQLQSHTMKSITTHALSLKPQNDYQYSSLEQSANKMNRIITKNLALKRQSNQNCSNLNKVHTSTNLNKDTNMKSITTQALTMKRQIEYLYISRPKFEQETNGPTESMQYRPRYQGQGTVTKQYKDIKVKENILSKTIIKTPKIILDFDFTIRNTPTKGIKLSGKHAYNSMRNQKIFREYVPPSDWVRPEKMNKHKPQSQGSLPSNPLPAQQFKP